MNNQEYRSKIEWLFNQFPVFQKVGDKAYKPTLENTLSLIKLFKVPLQEMRFVHVAGTNGKGTTCSIIASTLQSADLKVGLFTSPHIKDFRERIRVNGLMISETEVVNAVHQIQASQLDFSPSFFEITWVLALSHFYKQNCDVVVVETGLGGRLDATNVIQPELSVITNIGLDHVAILGNDMVQIAKEKAGIIKTKTPVIVGEYTSETEKVFNEVANKLHSNIYFLPPNSNETTFEKNQRLAFKAVDIFMKDYPEKATIKKKGIKNLYQNTGLLGRNQVYSTSPLIIMDAAHNEMGIERLIEDVQKKYLDKNVRVLYGASNDKDLDQIIKLFPLEWEYFFTEFKNNRSTKIDVFKEKVKLIKNKSHFFSDTLEAFEAAQKLNNKEDMLLVFGSFFLLEEII